MQAEKGQESSGLIKKGPLLKLVGWQQRLESDDDNNNNDNDNDNDSLAKDVDPPSTSADAAYEHEDNTRPKRRQVVWEAGQAHPKHNPLGLLPPQQLSQRLRNNFDPFGEATGSDTGRAYGGDVGISYKRHAPNARNSPKTSSRGTVYRPRTRISPTATGRSSSIDSVCRIVTGSIDPFQIFPVKMDQATQSVLYRRELRFPYLPQEAFSVVDFHKTNRP